MNGRNAVTLVGKVYVSSDRFISLEPMSDTDYLCDYGNGWAYFSRDEIALILFPEQGREA